MLRRLNCSSPAAVSRRPARKKLLQETHSEVQRRARHRACSLRFSLELGVRW
jgi:hypothetical protein